MFANFADTSSSSSSTSDSTSDSSSWEDSSDEEFYGARHHRGRHHCGRRVRCQEKGWNAAISPYILTKGEGSSAGTAVCSRTHIGARNCFAEGCIGKLAQARFQMKRFGAVCKGGIHFGSCYLHCNWDQNRTFNLDLLQRISAMIATVRGPWIIGGDWQCTPEDLQKTGWLKIVKGVIYAPAARPAAKGFSITSSLLKGSHNRGRSSPRASSVMPFSGLTVRYA